MYESSGVRGICLLKRKRFGNIPKYLTTVSAVFPKRVLRSLLAMPAVNGMLGSFGLDVHVN